MPGKGGAAMSMIAGLSSITQKKAKGKDFITVLVLCPIGNFRCALQ